MGNIQDNVRKGYCTVVEPDCKAAPGMATRSGAGPLDEAPVGKCRVCAADVCTNRRCSRFMTLKPWFGPLATRGRVCANCQDEGQST